VALHDPQLHGESRKENSTLVHIPKNHFTANLTVRCVSKNRLILGENIKKIWASFFYDPWCRPTLQSACATHQLQAFHSQDKANY